MAGLAGLVALPWLGSPAFAQMPPGPPPRPPGLEATGEGTVSEPPDLALASLGVTTQAPSAKEAMAQNAAVAQKVVAALRAAGLIAPDAIRTQGINLSPMMEGKPGERQTLVGYRASNQLEIQTPLAMLGPAFDAALAAGATDIGAQRFALASRERAELRALELAVIDARARVETMARALGKKVTRIVEVRTLDGVRPGPEPYAMARAAAAPVPVEPGLLTVRARVLLRADWE
ncbi:MAG: SIMPL domain-containing protein [Candidatus Rokubacteria bacterium]|nr:SIMPL domain-containing protein [Candidatus Rokubacteria bacterium]